MNVTNISLLAFCASIVVAPVSGNTSSADEFNEKMRFLSLVQKANIFDHKNEKQNIASAMKLDAVNLPITKENLEAAAVLSVGEKEKYPLTQENIAFAIELKRAMGAVKLYPRALDGAFALKKASLPLKDASNIQNAHTLMEQEVDLNANNLRVLADYKKANPKGLLQGGLINAAIVLDAHKMKLDSISAAAIQDFAWADNKSPIGSQEGFKEAFQKLMKPAAKDEIEKAIADFKEVNKDKIAARNNK